jgi:RNA polymerase subunit RPABC4/transcription elongation factor Spt4
MRVLAIFGLHGGLNLAVQLLLLVLVALWLALAFWTYADARRRVEDPMLVACAAAGSLFFPFVGAIVYAIVRPPEYLEDVRERELEIAAAEARLAQVESLSCPHCGFEVEKTFLRCPSCMHKLKEPCSTCGRPLDPRWKICPYCESEVTTTAAPQRRRPVRRAAPAAGTPAAERAAAPVRQPPSRADQPARRPTSDPA